MAVSTKFQTTLKELIDEIFDVKKSELPKEMGIDYRSFSAALNYGIVPTTKILMRIADYFSVSINFLLGNTDDRYFAKTKNQSNFYDRLEHLCKRRDITFYKLSQDCSFDKSYIYRWILKNYLPSLEYLDIVASYFEVSIDYLLGRTDDEK